MTPSPHLRFVLALTTCLTLGLAACSKDTTAQVSAGESGSGSDADFFAPPSEFDPSKFVPDGTKSADGQVTKDFAKRSLPTDVYLDQDFTTIENASSLFLHHCLKERGVDSPKPTPDPPFKNQPSPVENPVTGEYIFNEQSAARDGYQPYSGENFEDTGGPALPEDPFDEFLFKYLSWDKENAGETGANPNGEPAKKTPEQTNFEECNAKFHQEFKAPGVDYTNGKFPTIEEQKKDPNHFALLFNHIDTPYIQEKAKEWKACMQPLGIPDLPETPNEMPPESKDKVWHPEDYRETNEQGEPVDENGNVVSEGIPVEPVISEEEKAVATKDAQCRTSSGWDRAVYDTQWGLLTDHLKENEAGIKQYMNEQKAYIEKLKAYIEKN